MASQELRRTVMNPRVAQLLLTAFVLGTTLSAVAAEKKIDRSALPPAVEKTVQAQSQGATIKGFTTEVEHGKRAYEVELIVEGHSKDIEIAENGTVNEVEEEISFDSLAATVQAALKTKAAGAKITKVESLTKKDKLVAYQVGPDGEALSHEE
jgi:uncharacterized membrane protein YkoI